MPVGNTTAAIKYSEIQTYYGGSNPISASEYYRGGSNVPSSVTVTDAVAHNSSGTGSGTAGAVTVTVGTNGTYNTSSTTNVNSNQPRTYNIAANQTYSGYVTNNDGDQSGFVSGSGPTSVTLQGIGADGGHSITITTTNDAYDIDYTNNNSYAVTLTSATTGVTGTQVLAASGGTFKGQDGSADSTQNQAWTVAHNQVTSTDNTVNTGIPASGAIDLEDFRSVTNENAG